MAASSKKSTKSKITKNTRTAKPRKLPEPKYRSFKLSKRIVHPAPKLLGAFKLFRGSIKHLLEHKKLYLGIVAVYFLLTIILVKGLGFDSGLAELKPVLEEGTGKLLTGLTIFSLLLGTTNSAGNNDAAAYQSILLIVVSLALIWALRQSYAKKRVTMRDAFYKGMYPLVPFIIVLIVIGLQLLPLAIGSWLYAIAASVAVNAGEHLLWLLILGALGLLSLYMVSSSLFALYIVTLPDVRPMQALRSARKLVQHRRYAVMRKVLFLPLALLLAGIVIMLPLILFVTPAAEWVFFTLTMFSLAVIHSYMYGLYRELLPHDT